MDLVVVNWGSPRWLYHNQSDTTFTRIATGPLVNDVTEASGAAWADYDGDGDLDLFVPNCLMGPNVPKRNSLYRNEGGGTFTAVTTGHPGEEASLNFSGAWGDYDNDGNLDLYVCYGYNDRGNFLFQNNGDGTFTKITSGVVLSSKGAASAAWGDYDNDGCLDLFLAGGILGNRYYHNSGDGTFTQAFGEPGTAIPYEAAAGCDWGDYDDDGFLDLFVANGVIWPGQTKRTSNFLYHNEGNANRWLKVKLEGTVSNRAAIGAKVRVRAALGGTTMWQLREVGVGHSGSGAILLPHFGLRDADKADVVRIEWPSGIVQELRDVSVDQTVTITEPPRLEALGIGRISIRCRKGQKFEVEVSNDLLTWTSLGLATNEAGTLEVADPDAGNHPYRF